MLANSGSLAVASERRVHVSANNLGVAVTSKDTESGTFKILDSVSFDLPKSNMMAIMGGSGAGKTTLLNVLAQRTNIKSSALKFSGSVTYASDQGRARVNTAYMVQQDLFLPGLTLLETLSFQADLRLGNISKESRRELIATLLELLELEHRKDEIIKTFTEQINLSGGEQRRVSLAIQLLNKPELLFLDEPTTGLDTSSALTMVSVLRKLASPEIGITIIMSIHQPRAEVIDLFDKLCVLTRGGRLVYYGSLADSVPYFTLLEGNGVITKIENASDSFNTLNRIMNSSVKDTSSAEKEAQSSAVTDSLANCWKQHNPVVYNLTPEQEEAQFRDNLKVFEPADPLPLYRELYVLVRRTILISLRDRYSLISLHCGALLLSIIIGWLFFKPDPDLSGIRSITSCLYALLEVVGFSPLTMEISRLWFSDGTFFFKEYRENCVSAPGFVISRRLGKLFVEDVPMVCIFTVVTYFMWGLRLGESYLDSGDGSFFGIYFTIVLLVGICSMSLATFCFSLAPDFSLSVTCVNVIYQLQNCGCGYFVNSASMPVYVRWVKYLAFFWYSFGGLLSNQYTDWSGNCPYPSSDFRCTEYTGNYQLSILGFPEGWTGAPIGYLVLWVVGINLASIIVLHFRNYDVEIAKKKKNKIGGSDASSADLKGLMSSSSSLDEKQESVRGASISLRDVTLSVKVKMSQSPFAKKEERVLLNNVTANFKSDSVNAIMGPSGGGKTTMLKFLANRLSRSDFSRNGTVLLNANQEITPVKLGVICAFVAQTDDLLIAELTVRETLFYQARLRLPYEEHPRIPQYINQILRDTGLLDCAETPIGDAATKGCSGGEKRRVSIAIQLLSKPKILFLDEPTSGLDSASSVKILALLKQLAQSGTTIITTLHQPNKSMFKSLDSLVLLARGGFVVYDGPTMALASYLEKMNFKCPATVNLADHALDLVSLNFTETKEQSQSRIEYLIKEWQVRGPIYEDSDLFDKPVDLKSFKRPTVPIMVTLKAICSRQFVVSYRNTSILTARLIQVSVLGIIYALFFSPLKHTQEGVSDRLGLIQNSTNLFYCGLVNNLSLFPSQRTLFHQEHRDKTYGSMIFSSAYLLVELPFELIPSIIFSVFYVFPTYMPRSAGMYFTTLYCSIALLNCGESAGIFFNSLFTHMGLVTNILSNLFIVGIFMAGTMSLQMPDFFKAWNYLNPSKYVVQILTNMIFEGETFRCNGGTCALSTGQAVLDQYGLNADIKAAFGALTACLVLMRVIAFAMTWGRAKWFM